MGLQRILAGLEEFALQVLLGDLHKAQMWCGTFAVLSAVERYVEWAQ